MTLEQALLVAISSLTVVVLALWRKSVNDESQCRLDIKGLHEQINMIWRELHQESVLVMKGIITTTTENTQILNALHRRIDRLDILRVVTDEDGQAQSSIERK